MENALRSDGQTPTITCFLMVERWFFSHHHSQYFVEVFIFHFHRICLLNLPHYGGCQPKHDWFCPSKPFWRNTFHKKMSNPSISLFSIFLYKKTHQYVKPLQCIATYQCTWEYLRRRGWRCTCWWWSAFACWTTPPPAPEDFRWHRPGCKYEISSPPMTITRYCKDESYFFHQDDLW